MLLFERRSTCDMSEIEGKNRQKRYASPRCMGIFDFKDLNVTLGLLGVHSFEIHQVNRCVTFI